MSSNAGEYHTNVNIRPACVWMKFKPEELAAVNRGAQVIGHLELRSQAIEAITVSNLPW
jgi:hypothetical protein